MEGNPQGSTQVGIVVDCGWWKANNWQVAFERCALRTLHINTHHTATIMVMDKMIWASEATKKHTVSQQPAGRKNGSGRKGGGWNSLLQTSPILPELVVCLEENFHMERGRDGVSDSPEGGGEGGQ